MVEYYFELRYARRIKAVIDKTDTEYKKNIPINKNYIIQKLKIKGFEYQSCVNAFNKKYPKYKEYYDLYYNESRALFFSNPVELLNWFKEQNNRCGYCGIRKDDLKTLAIKRGTPEKPNITLNGKTKRSKGTLEIEKKDSTKGYTYQNCILACPLCNNAKSNLIDENGWKNIFVPSMKEYYKSILGYPIKS